MHYSSRESRFLLCNSHFSQISLGKITDIRVLFLITPATIDGLLRRWEVGQWSSLALEQMIGESWRSKRRVRSRGSPGHAGWEAGDCSGNTRDTWRDQRVSQAIVCVGVSVDVPQRGRRLAPGRRRGRSFPQSCRCCPRSCCGCRR